MSTKVRHPAVAGTFYPADPQRLKHDVLEYMSQPIGQVKLVPKAIIAPHAGYIYSGPIAGSAYASFKNKSAEVSRIVLLGPAHYAPVRGLAVSDAEAFATPLGSVPVNMATVNRLLTLPQVTLYSHAHSREHCLEVQLPFLQELFSDFEVVPVVVGDATQQEVAEVLEATWGGHETIIVVSSDLSHYHDYKTAVYLDQRTSEAIEGFRPLIEGQACGRNAINGLLQVARTRGLWVKTTDLRNSGDTAGPRDRVVGYGAFLFFEEERNSN